MREYRVREIRESTGDTWFFPQKKSFFGWSNFRKIVDADCTGYIEYVDLAFKTFKEAEHYIFFLVDKKEVINHYFSF